MTNAVCTYDFTFNTTEDKDTEIQCILNKNFKKWCVQYEKGEKTGNLHYQGRVSLKVKKRLKQACSMFQKVLPGVHLSITSSANKDNDFYVTKDDTRLRGPWSNVEYEEIYIPRQIREIARLLPWQQQVTGSTFVKIQMLGQSNTFSLKLYLSS